jgi:hypothetical protein
MTRAAFALVLHRQRQPLRIVSAWGERPSAEAVLEVAPPAEGNPWRQVAPNRWASGELMIELQRHTLRRAR